jgi:hypothetical protein
METKKIENGLVEVLRRKNRDFIPLGELKRAPKTVRDAAGIRSKDSAARVAQRIRPHLTGRLTILQGSRTKYLAFNQPDEAIVAALIRERPGTSLKQLAQASPFRKAEFLNALNAMLQRGDVRCEIAPDYAVKLHPAQSIPDGRAVTPDREPPPVQSESEPFLAACGKLDRGQEYIRIHEIRDALGWSRERFDRVLESLRDEGAVQLHAGDIATMSEEEVRKSYVDENNFFLATLTRRTRDASA